MYKLSQHAPIYMLSKNMYSRVLLNLKKKKGVIVAKTYLMLESGVKKKKKVGMKSNPF